MSKKNLPNMEKMAASIKQKVDAQQKQKKEELEKGLTIAKDAAKDKLQKSPVWEKFEEQQRKKRALQMRLTTTASRYQKYTAWFRPRGDKKQKALELSMKNNLAKESYDSTWKAQYDRAKTRWEEAVVGTGTDKLDFMPVAATATFIIPLLYAMVAPIRDRTNTGPQQIPIAGYHPKGHDHEEVPPDSEDEGINIMIPGGDGKGVYLDISRKILRFELDIFKD